MELWTTPETHHNVGAVRAASSSAGLSEHSGDTCTPRTRRKIKNIPETITGTGTSASGGLWQPMARISNTGATGVKRFEALFAYARDWAVTDCEDRRAANKRVGRLEKRACWTTSDADTREVKWGRPALAGRARQVRAGDLARHDKNAWPLRGDQTFVCWLFSGASVRPTCLARPTHHGRSGSSRP